MFVELGQRRIPVQFAKRVVGRRMMGGQNTYIPLKVNQSGVIPIIFASSILLMPLTAAGFSGTGGPEWLIFVSSLLGRGQPLFLLIFVSLIVFFAFFYTSIVFNPQETADNLRKYGGYIPGIRPGTKTAEYIDYVLTRITVVGALYLTAVCLLPELMIANTPVPQTFAVILGGTSLLIVVGVGLDTASQIEAHLISRSYEGFMQGVTIKGRRG